MLTKTHRRNASLPPLKRQGESYIKKTMDLLDAGCSEKGHLKIDGDIGDYRMRLFRRKDKNEYLNSVRSVFTNTFTQSLLPEEN